MQEKIKSGQSFSQGRKDRAKEITVFSVIQTLYPMLLQLTAAFLLGCASLPFETSPLGIAFLSASESNGLPILLGLLLSVTVSKSEKLIWSATYLSAAIIRFFSNQLNESKAGREAKFFGERISLRIASSAVCLLFLSLYRIVLGGFAYYDLFAAVLSVTVAPLATAIFSLKENQKIKEEFQRISLALFLLALVYSAKGLPAFGIQTCYALTLFFSFWLCEKFGFLYGMLFSLPAGACISLKFLPSFLPSVFLFDSVRKKGNGGVGIFFSCLLALFFSFFLEGLSAFSKYFLFAMASGTAYYLYEKLILKSVAVKSKTKENAGAGRLPEVLAELEYTESRLLGLSDSYASLAEMFYKFGNRMKQPSLADMQNICAEAVSEYCSGCREKEKCTLREEFLNALPEQLFKRKSIEPEAEQGKETNASLCGLKKRILRSIQKKQEELSKELLKNDRNEVLAMNYEGFAGQIRSVLEEKRNFLKQNEKLTRLLYERLEQSPLAQKQMMVLGMRRKEVTVKPWKTESDGDAEILTEVANELTFMKMSPRRSNEKNLFHLVAEPKIRVIGAKFLLPKSGSVCGDSLSCFSDKEGRIFALINDGMGNGKEAADASGLSCVTLEKLLRMGGNSGAAIKTLHQMLLSKRSGSKEEYSVTVDLMELNLYTGRACFYKCGAAACFVIRGESLHKLQNETAPIGILSRAEIGSTDFQLRPGDSVLLVSDGVLEEGEEALTELLSESSFASPKELLSKIIRILEQRSQRDDCSGIALRILPLKEYEEGQKLFEIQTVTDASD